MLAVGLALLWLGDDDGNHVVRAPAASAVQR